MQRILGRLTLSFLLFLIVLSGLLMKPKTTLALGACDPKVGSGSFLGFPTWYEYLPGEQEELSGASAADSRCVPKICPTDDKGECIPGSGQDLAKIWLIGLAVIEILLRLGGLAAIGIVIFGGFKYITSQGNPDATKSARGTIINAFVGIVIIIIASVSVGFLAGLLQ